MTRTIEERVERLLCAEHCRFFKPWHGEDRRCAAHTWLLHLALGNPGIIEALEKLRGARAPAPLQADALLLRTTCTHCDYYPYDCRYRDPARPTGAVPCGGIVALDLMLERGTIGAEDLYALPRTREARVS